MKRLVPIFLIIFLSSTLLSCTAPVEATPSPTPIPTSTPTPTPTPLPTPTPTPLPTPTPTPLPIQLKGLEGITLRKISVSVEQSYPQIEEEFTQPIKETISRILGSMGIATCEQGELCDASLNIALAIRAIQAEYTGGEKCYTGAKAEGQMTLSIPDHEPVNLSIPGYRKPPGIIYNCPKDPSSAHYIITLAWGKALLNGFYEIWSIQVLTNALQDQDHHLYIRYAAAIALQDLGPDAAQAVPTLITVVSDDVEVIRVAAFEALEAIGPSAIEAVPVLVEIINNECTTFGERYAADVIAAIKPQDEQVVQVLTHCLEKFDYGYPRCVINALKEIGPAAINAVPDLVSRLEEGEDYTNKEILEALRAITGQDFGLDANQWLEWWEKQQ